LAFLIPHVGEGDEKEPDPTEIFVAWTNNHVRTNPFIVARGFVGEASSGRMEYKPTLAGTINVSA